MCRARRLDVLYATITRSRLRRRLRPAVAARRQIRLRRVPYRDVLRLHRRVYTRARVQVRARLQSFAVWRGSARPRSEPVAIDSCLVPPVTHLFGGNKCS